MTPYDSYLKSIGKSVLLSRLKRCRIISIEQMIEQSDDSGNITLCERDFYISSHDIDFTIAIVSDGCATFSVAQSDIEYSAF